jgi:hypothetical protein
VVEIDTTGLSVVSRLDENRLERLRPGLPLVLRLAPLFTDAEGRQVVSWSFAAVRP